MTSQYVKPITEMTDLLQVEKALLVIAEQERRLQKDKAILLATKAHITGTEHPTSITMRDMVLEEIENMRGIDEYDWRTMRWSQFWFHPNVGVDYDPGKKNRSGWCRLTDVTKEQFANLPNRELFASYMKLLRQFCKQM